MDTPESVYVITGATHGLGRACAIELAQRSLGCVVLACRNRVMAVNLANKICEEFKVSRGRIIVLEETLDLSEELSVRRYALSLSNWLKEERKTITTLINNAGIGGARFSTNSRGYDLVISTNYLGHFLLTILLLPYIRGRVVNVSSQNHDPENGIPGTHPEISYPQTESEYIGQALYGRVPLPEGLKARELRLSRSKLFQILFTYELSRRINGSYPQYIPDSVKEVVTNLPRGNSCNLAEGKSISVIAMCPGALPESNAMSGMLGPTVGFIIWLLIPILRMIPYCRRLMRTLKESGHHLANLALFPRDGGTAGFFVDGVAVPSSKFTLSSDGLTKHAIMLWDLSVQWTNLTEDELKAAGL